MTQTADFHCITEIKSMFIESLMVLTVQSISSPFQLNCLIVLELNTDTDCSEVIPQHWNWTTWNWTNWTKNDRSIIFAHKGFTQLWF